MYSTICWKFNTNHVCCYHLACKTISDQMRWQNYYGQNVDMIAHLKANITWRDWEKQQKTQSHKITSALAKTRSYYLLSTCPVPSLTIKTFGFVREPDKFGVVFHLLYWSMHTFLCRLCTAFFLQKMFLWIYLRKIAAWCNKKKVHPLWRNTPHHNAISKELCNNEDNTDVLWMLHELMNTFLFK
jgi:hypothetical protein